MNNSIGTRRRQSRLSLCQVFASLLSNERLSHRAGLTERERLSCQSAAVTLCSVLGASLPPRELFVALLSAAAGRGSIVSEVLFTLAGVSFCGTFLLLCIECFFNYKIVTIYVFIHTLIDYVYKNSCHVLEI